MVSKVIKTLCLNFTSYEVSEVSIVSEIRGVSITSCKVSEVSKVSEIRGGKPLNL